MSQLYNKKNWSALFFIIAIISIFIALGLSATNSVINLDEVKNQQLIDNKKPISYPLPKDIHHLKIMVNSDDNPRSIYLNITFADTDNIVMEQDLTEATKEYFADIDLHKLKWTVVDDALVVNLSKALQTHYYMKESLQITLPRSLNTLTIADNVGYNYNIANYDTPINLTANIGNADFSGTFDNLTINQTQGCDNPDDNNYCLGFVGTDINTLTINAIQRYISDYKKPNDEDFSLENVTDQDISVRFDTTAHVKHFNLNAHKNSRLIINDLSLLNAINWHEQKIIDKKYD